MRGKVVGRHLLTQRLGGGEQQNSDLDSGLLAPPSKRVNRWRHLLSVLALLSGLALFVYPVVATVINNQKHQLIVKEVMEKSKNINSNNLEQDFINAQKYNQIMTNGPFLDPFLQQVVPDSPQYHEYLKVLNFTDGVMGSIHIPAVKVQLPIYHGTSDGVIDKGAGHLFGASLPVGGSNTKTVITAHSGLGNASMFDGLRYIKNGDAVFFNIGNKTLKYEVYDQKVVLPEQTEDLLIEKNRDLAVLITCTPYGINTHRLLVFAKRVEFHPEVDGVLAQEKFESPWRIWMYFSLAAVVLSVLLYLWFVVFGRHRYKKDNATLSEIAAINQQIPSGNPEGGDKTFNSP